MEYRLLELLRIALKYQVGDIHFDYDNRINKIISIEMRVKDEIKRIKESEEDTKLFRYLIYLSNLDVSNMMNPQTGSFEIDVDNKHLSLRFAVISTINNTNGVLRILSNTLNLRIEDLTMFEDDIYWLKRIINHKNGLIVFSGPTGSGKTTTLYTLLNSIKNKKIFTLEDPIEVLNDNFIQIQINEKMNISYATGIKQLMRHDPDIVMVGEIRDEEAANMAVRCALTGHLVITSIHSSSCVSAINRLLDLGVNKIHLQDILIGITSQNLFLNNKNKYITVYEIFDRKDIDYYFETGKYLKEHISLEQKIELFKENGYI